MQLRKVEGEHIRVLTKLLAEPHKQSIPRFSLLFELSHPVAQMEEPAQHMSVEISVEKKKEIQKEKEDESLGHELDENTAASALILTRRVVRRRRRGERS